MGRTASGRDIIADGTFSFGGRLVNANDAGLMDKIEEELKFAAGDTWALRQEQIHAYKMEHPDDALIDTSA